MKVKIYVLRIRENIWYVPFDIGPFNNNLDEEKIKAINIVDMRYNYILNDIYTSDI